MFCPPYVIGRHWPLRNVGHCVNTDLCDTAKCYSTMSIFTFDQLLWQMAMTTIENKPKPNLHGIMLRLGGFHSLLMHHIKFKSPSKFLWNEQNFLWVDLSIFTQLLLWHYCNDKKPTGYWWHYHSRCRPLAHMEPGVHTMSNELLLQISCNIFVAFKWISMMRSSHNISNYTTAKLSVHVWNNDLIWQNKIGTQKDFHKNRIASS